MNYKIDTLIRTKWHRGFQRKKPVSEIVIHGTDGGGTYDFVLRGDGVNRLGEKFSETYKKGVALFHYLIEPGGDVIEIIDPERWVYHSTSGKHDELTIGIEVQKNSNVRSKPTQEQMFALVALCQMLIKRFPKIDRVVSHDYNGLKYSARPPKPCPGAFDWGEFERLLDNENVVVIK